MLILPFLLGLAVSGAQTVHIPLFLCWLTLYLFSFPVLQWIKTGKKDRYLKPALLYGVILVPLVIVILLYKWQLLFYGAVLLLLFTIPMLYARAKNERALVNDITAILLFCSFIYPVVYVGAGASSDWTRVTLLFVLISLYFIGTALYVKTVIREKKNPHYYQASLIYHLLLIPFAAWMNLSLIVPFVILLLRAEIFPKKNIKVKHTGMAEIGFAAMLYVFLLIAYV